MLLSHQWNVPSITFTNFTIWFFQWSWLAEFSIRFEPWIRNATFSPVGTFLSWKGPIESMLMKNFGIKWSVLRSLTGQPFKNICRAFLKSFVEGLNAKNNSEITMGITLRKRWQKRTKKIKTFIVSKLKTHHWCYLNRCRHQNSGHSIYSRAHIHNLFIFVYSSCHAQ